MLSAVFITGGVDVLKNPEPRVKLAAPVLDKIGQLVPPLAGDPVTLVRANAATQVVAGAMLATGRMPRLAAAALAASLVPTTFGGHRFWELDDPAQRAQQRVHFLKNTAILGGLLIAATT